MDIKKTNFLELLAVLYPLGLIRYAPGTIGSLLSLIIFSLFINYVNITIILIITFLILIISFISIKVYLTKHMVNDPPEVIIDEFSGQLIALLAIPILDIEINFISIILAFILFRFFDISKIGLKKIENIGGPWGVLLDDIVAGIYSFILQYFIWKFLF